jgi:hypothetical protein
MNIEPRQMHGNHNAKSYMDQIRRYFIEEGYLDDQGPLEKGTDDAHRCENPGRSAISPRRS